MKKLVFALIPIFFLFLLTNVEAAYFGQYTHTYSKDLCNAGNDRCTPTGISFRKNNWGEKVSDSWHREWCTVSDGDEYQNQSICYNQTKYGETYSITYHNIINSTGQWSRYKTPYPYTDVFDIQSDATGTGWYVLQRDMLSGSCSQGSPNYIDYVMWYSNDWASYSVVWNISASLGSTIFNFGSGGISGHTNFYDCVWKPMGLTIITSINLCVVDYYSSTAYCQFPITPYYLPNTYYINFTEYRKDGTRLFDRSYFGLNSPYRIYNVYFDPNQFKWYVSIFPTGYVDVFSYTGGHYSFFDPVIPYWQGGLDIGNTNVAQMFYLGMASAGGTEAYIYEYYGIPEPTFFINVIDMNNNPIANSSVELQNTATGVFSVGVSNSDGKAYFSLEEYQSYRVLIYDDVFGMYESMGSTFTYYNNMTSLTFQLKNIPSGKYIQYFHVIGNVLDKDTNQILFTTWLPQVKVGSYTTSSLTILIEEKYTSAFGYTWFLLDNADILHWKAQKIGWGGATGDIIGCTKIKINNCEFELQMQSIQTTGVEYPTPSTEMMKPIVNETEWTEQGYGWATVLTTPMFILFCIQVGLSALAAVVTKHPAFPAIVMICATGVLGALQVYPVWLTIILLIISGFITTYTILKALGFIQA